MLASDISARRHTSKSQHTPTDVPTPRHDRWLRTRLPTSKVGPCSLQHAKYTANLTGWWSREDVGRGHWGWREKTLLRDTHWIIPSPMYVSEETDFMNHPYPFSTTLFSGFFHALPHSKSDHAFRHIFPFAWQVQARPRRISIGTACKKTFSPPSGRRGVLKWNQRKHKTLLASPRDRAGGTRISHDVNTFSKCPFKY